MHRLVGTNAIKRMSYKPFLQGNLRRKITSVRLCAIFVCLCVTLFSCVDEVQLPIRQVERRLVVDGLITDEPPPYPVKLTYSGNLKGPLLIPDELAINGAIVTIEDNFGNRAQLIQDPLNLAFYWMRDARLRGVPGRRYTLRVTLPDGSRYVSRPELMPPVAPIERLYGEYRESDRNTSDLNTFLVRIDTQDPPTPGNYYRWQALSYIPVWSGSDPLRGRGAIAYAPFYGTLTNVLSDALINGNRVAGRLVLTSPLVGLGAQYVETRQYSLTREAYQYWTRYEQQLARSGTLFDAQPASIEGNVYVAGDSTRLTLGYFGASAVSRQRIIMETDTLDYNAFVARFGPVLFSNTPPSVPGLAREQTQAAPPARWLTYGR